MSNPTDPNDPNYRGLPNFPSAPPAADMQQQRFTPPQEIMWSFWCYVAGALILIVSGVLAAAQRQQFVTALRQNPSVKNLTPDQFNAAVTAAIVLQVVLAVVISALYVLFAFKIRQGRNWARIVLTVVAALALIALLLTGGSSVLSVIGRIAAVLGCVASYLPNSTAYINAVRAGRLGG